MAYVAVALTGSHGTGKTWIMEELERRSRDAGHLVETVPSPTRYIKHLGGYTNNKDATWQFQFMCLAETHRRILEAQNSLANQDSEHWMRGRVLIADRCVLDPVHYIGDWLERNRCAGHLDLGDPKAHVWSRMHQLYDLAKLFAADGSMLFNRIYYKAPHPGYLPEGDADRLAERQYQLDVDRIAKAHLEQDWVSKLNLETVDIDRTKAADQMWEFISKRAEMAVTMMWP